MRGQAFRLPEIDKKVCCHDERAYPGFGLGARIDRGPGRGKLTVTASRRQRL